LILRPFETYGPSRIAGSGRFVLLSRSRSKELR